MVFSFLGKMDHSCIPANNETTCYKQLLLQKFFIQVFAEEKSCEECGSVYHPLHNFCMISCCGPVMRVCNTCNWETVPCVDCTENKVGDIIINKKINKCVACKEEKIVKKRMEKNI